MKENEPYKVAMELLQKYDPRQTMMNPAAQQPKPMAKGKLCCEIFLASVFNFVLVASCFTVGQEVQVQSWDNDIQQLWKCREPQRHHLNQLRDQLVFHLNPLLVHLQFNPIKIHRNLFFLLLPVRESLFHQVSSQSVL